MRKFLKGLFGCKKIVYSKKVMPGELVRVYTFKGKKYVRIAITNRVRFKSTVPMTDIPWEMVEGIRVLPSAFKKGVYNLFGIKAKATFHKFVTGMGKPNYIISKKA